MTILEVCEKYTADERCRELLARLRWSNGVECPRCKSTDVKTLSERVFWCAKCEYQFSVTAGTIFHDSHLPLLKWFAAVYLMCESKKGMSALQLKRMLGVSYKTAWYLCHRIRHSMQALGRELLTGTVEMDETYVGGVARGKGRGPHYLDEMAFRFNRRNTTDLFEDTLRHMVRTDPLTFAELTVASSK